MKTTSTTATVRSGRAATRMIVCVGMLAAISTILMLFEFPLPFLAPGFYELDFSEVPILIGAFALGPVAGVLTELVKVLLNLVVNGTQTAFVGEFANFVMGCMFVLPASLIYKMKKSRKHAVIGLAAGTVYCFRLMRRHLECRLMHSWRWDQPSTRQSTVCGRL